MVKTTTQVHGSVRRIERQDGFNWEYRYRDGSGRTKQFTLPGEKYATAEEAKTAGSDLLGLYGPPKQTRGRPRRSDADDILRKLSPEMREMWLEVGRELAAAQSGPTPDEIVRVARS